MPGSVLVRPAPCVSWFALLRPSSLVDHGVQMVTMCPGLATMCDVYMMATMCTHISQDVQIVRQDVHIVDGLPLDVGVDSPPRTCSSPGHHDVLTYPTLALDAIQVALGASHTRTFPPYTHTLFTAANQGNTSPQHENHGSFRRSTLDSKRAGLEGLRYGGFCTERTVWSLRSHPSPLTRQSHDLLVNPVVCSGCSYRKPRSP